MSQITLAISIHKKELWSPNTTHKHGIPDDCFGYALIFCTRLYVYTHTRLTREIHWNSPPRLNSLPHSRFPPRSCRSGECFLPLLYFCFTCFYARLCSISVVVSLRYVVVLLLLCRCYYCCYCFVVAATALCVVLLCLDSVISSYVGISLLFPLFFFSFPPNIFTSSIT